MVMSLIYLDHAATTPIHSDVLEAMLPFYSEVFGNPSSIHSFGRAAKMAIDQARDTIAHGLGCLPGQLLFTSGGTESNNTAIFGVLQALKGQKKHMITTCIEHHAVLHPCEWMESLGYEVTYLPVDSTGLIDVQDVEAAIRQDTALISVMYGNNEIGTLQPIEEIGNVARARGIAFHVDAVQALGKVPIDLTKLPVDLMSFSSHKINGPKGIGALYVSKTTHMTPLLFGGSQERKRRAGTENVAGIVGFAKAMEISLHNLTNMQLNTIELRQIMVNRLITELGSEGFVINGHLDKRLPHILNVSFPGVNTESLLMNLDLDGIAAASGSACSSGSLSVSHVLKAMQLPESITSSAVRFSFGMGNSKEQIDTAAHKTATIVRRLRTNE
jgi:cysteine desulfurase